MARMLWSAIIIMWRIMLELARAVNWNNPD